MRDVNSGTGKLPCWGLPLRSEHFQAAFHLSYTLTASPAPSLQLSWAKGGDRFKQGADSDILADKLQTTVTSSYAQSTQHQ